MGIDGVVVVVVLGRYERVRILLVCAPYRTAKRGIALRLRGEVGIVCCVVDGLEWWARERRCAPTKAEE